MTRPVNTRSQLSPSKELQCGCSCKVALLYRKMIHVPGTKILYVLWAQFFPLATLAATRRVNMEASALDDVCDLTLGHACM